MEIIIKKKGIKKYNYWLNINDFWIKKNILKGHQLVTFDF